MTPRLDTARRTVSVTVGLFSLTLTVGVANSIPTAFALKVAHCGNATCAAGNTITTVYNPTNNVGALNSIAIGIDGLPVISFFDSTAGSLKVAHCGNPACSMGTSITTVDNASDVGQCSSIAIGIDGLPVISYQTEGVSIALKVAKCGT